MSDERPRARFPEEIAYELMNEWPNTITSHAAATVTARAILALSEMQAIHAGIRSLVNTLVRTNDSTDPDGVILRAHGFPQSVIDWIETPS